MKINKKIISIARQYPNIANIGHSILKNYWNIKANFEDYQFPKNAQKASVEKELVVNFNKNRPYGPKKKICYAPFNNLHFQINGNVSACSFNYDFIIGNVTNSTIKEIWLGEKAKEFRDKLANYNFEMCKSCEKVLTAKNYNSFPPLKYDMFADDDISYPNQMSFEMSDLCNFECIMCNENFSSLIRKKKNLPPQKFKYPDRFFEELQEFLPHLKTATFIGGEPLIIKSYFRIWEDILAVNNSCVIHIQTNASFLPPRFLEMLETGQFDIGISLDATNKEIFEKIRINASFDDVQKNIQILKTYMDRNKVNLNINFCPLTENWEELPKIIEYSNKLNIPLKIVNVENPRHLSLQHKNVVYLNNIIQSLEKVNNFNPQNIIQEKNVHSYKQYLNHLSFLLKEAEEREAYFNNNQSVLTEKFKNLFIDGNLFYYLSNQKEQAYQECMDYVYSLTENEALRNRIIFRCYYSLFNIKAIHNGESSTNYNYAIDILKNMAKEFFELEKTELNY